MPLEYLIPFIVGGVLLSQGFFWVRAINRHVVFTRLGGAHLRAANPIGYWAWAVYYSLSLVFNFLIAIGVIIGLSSD